jgi:hypothetical protein
MPGFTESVVESDALAWLKAVGRQVGHTRHRADMLAAERYSWCWRSACAMRWRLQRAGLIRGRAEPGGALVGFGHFVESNYSQS